MRYDRGYGSWAIGAVERARKHLRRVSSVDHLFGYGKSGNRALRLHKKTCNRRTHRYDECRHEKNEKRHDCCDFAFWGERIHPNRGENCSEVYFQRVSLRRVGLRACLPAGVSANGMIATV